MEKVRKGYEILDERISLDNVMRAKTAGIKKI